MYEQGIASDYEGTPLATRHLGRRAREPVAPVGERGRTQPELLGISSIRNCRPAFPAQLGEVSLDTFYRAINKVERSLIRTEADEVTYNLHVMLRFDLELALLEGKLAVRTCPKPGASASRATSVSSRPTIGTACCRTCTGMTG